MKESYKEDLANHFGLGPYAGDGNIAGVASARGNAGTPGNGYTYLDFLTAKPITSRLIAAATGPRRRSFVQNDSYFSSTRFNSLPRPIRLGFDGGSLRQKVSGDRIYSCHHVLLRS